MKRTFLYTDEKSNKFWTIEITGSSYTVNYGKAGTAGQTQVKEFDDGAKCQKVAEKLIAEKIKKGYVEQDGSEVQNPGNPKPSKKVIVEADTSNEYGYLVDLNDKNSIENTLKAVIKHLDSDEILEIIEDRSLLEPEYGKMEDDEFVEYNYNGHNSSEDLFFSTAVCYPELHTLIVKYVKKIIKLNSKYDIIWVNDETQAGTNAVYNLVKTDIKYLPLYTEHLKSCSDGEHDVCQYEEVENILKLYGWSTDTLPIVVHRLLVDIEGGELFKSDEAKEFLTSNENINTLLKIFYKEIKNTYYADKEMFYKFLAEAIFPQNLVEEYAGTLFDYGQNNKVPTIEALEKGAEVSAKSKKVKYDYRDYKNRINAALKSLKMPELYGNRSTSKITGSDNMEYYTGIAVHEKQPLLGMYLSSVFLDYKEKDGKPETFKLLNDIYLMLPPDLTAFLYIPGFSTFATASTLKRFSPEITTDDIKTQFYTLFGFIDWMARELRLVNAGKKTCDAVKNELTEKVNTMQFAEPVNPKFEEQLKKYIGKTKNLTILSHDTENHLFCIESDTKNGKSVGVITFHPLINKVSITLPCYQGDMKGREVEVYEWCEQATKQIGGHVINGPKHNYVMIRHIIDADMITDAKSLQKLLLFDLIDGFAPTLATGIQRIVNGEEPMDVLDDQLEYSTEGINIDLPTDLKELGIYGKEGECMLLTFREYGKEFLEK